MTETSKVVFRYWEGDIIALFPEDTFIEDYFGENTKDLCTSYMHIGQHGAANYKVIIAESRPATPEEYESLLKELEEIGYKLEISPLTE